MKTPAFTIPLAWVLLAAGAVAQQPASNDSSLSGVSVGSQTTLQTLTNLPVGTTNLPSPTDQGLQGTSVAPSLATNPPATPAGLNA